MEDSNAVFFESRIISMEAIMSIIHRVGVQYHFTECESNKATAFKSNQFFFFF